MSSTHDLFWQMDRIDAAMNEVTGNGAPIEPPDSNGANDRIDQLTLICAAMWELMKEKLAVQEDELVAKVAEIDARERRC